jgi:hypothetical protein
MLEHSMTRRPFKPTRTAVALQTASLLLAASSVVGILISDIARHRSAVPNAEAASGVLMNRSRHLTNAALDEILAPDPR